MKKQIRNSMVLFIAATVFGMLLLPLVYKVPVKGRMETHAWQALEVFEKEGFAPRLWGEDMGSRLDNFTDALMVQTAVYPAGGCALKEGMAAKRMQLDENNPDPIPDLRAQLEGKDGTEISYGRYWHGYLVWLKPLLYACSYSQIRMLNGAVQALLLAAVLIGMEKRGKRAYMLPFLISWLSTAPWILPLSMQNSAVYNLTMFSTAILLHFYDKIKKNLICYFLLVGVGTSFFDLLTYPAASFGIPFLFWLLLEKEEKTVFYTLKKMMALGIAWGIGYIGFWSVKWALGELILHDGVIREAVDSVKVRSLGFSEQSRSGYVKVCFRNLKRIGNPAFLTAAFGYVLFLAVRFWKQGKRKFMARAVQNAGLLLVAAVPFLWFLCTKNHADIHIHFTYRNLWVGVFAGLCLVSIACGGWEET